MQLRPSPARSPLLAREGCRKGWVWVCSTFEATKLLLLGRALSTKSFARELDLSAGTVKWHLKNVYGKLDAVSREDALAKARALGIVP